MEELTLENGIKLLFYPMMNTHSITVGLYIKAGVLYGEPKHGITHLLEHLHFRQLDHMSQNELYYKMECIGSTLRATTYRDCLSFSMKILPCYIEECLDIFVQLINASSWSSENFSKEKEVVINQIAAKGDYLSMEREVYKFIFRGHKLEQTIMGSEEQLAQIVLADVVKYKKQIFNTSDLVICIAGNISRSKLLEVITPLHKCTIVSSNRNTIPTIPKRFSSRKPEIKLINIEDNNPLEVNLSFDIRYQSQDKEALSVLNVILGEGVGSRLQQKIREEFCYSSDISSYIEWYQNFAVLHILFTVKKKQLFPCLNEIVQVLNDIKVKITPKDLDISLPFYTQNYAFLEDNTEEMNFQQAYHWLVLNERFQPFSLENTEITRNKIQELAKTVFMSQNLCVLVLGNTKGISQKSIRQVFQKENDIKRHIDKSPICGG